MLLVMALAAVVALGAARVWHHNRHHAQLDRTAAQIADFLLRLQLSASRGNHLCRISVTPGHGWTMIARLVTADGAPAVALDRLDSSVDTIRLDISQPGYLTLAGTRNTATAAHLAVSNSAGRLRIIVSGKGRVRMCSERGRWAGVHPC